MDSEKNAPTEDGKSQEGCFHVRMELPSHNNLDRECKWVSPEFSPITGIGPCDLWALKGLIVAIGFIDEQEQKALGSGIMVAPGLCLTATHVLQAMPKQPFLYSFANSTAMRIWILEDFHAARFKMELVPFQESKRKYSDVCLVSCSPFSAFTDSEPFYFGRIEASVPKIGERLWAVGYRETSNDGAPLIACFTSSGLVTNMYLEGRGSFIKGPCVEVAMNTVGGMSGGPVFNSAGNVVGIISTSLDGENGPTYVSLVWLTLVSQVHAPWPENYWPDKTAGLQVETKSPGPQVFGSARTSEDGAIFVKFSEQSPESMTDLLKVPNIINDPAVDIYDVSYELFENYLETEGLEHMNTLRSEKLASLIENSVPLEIGSLFETVDVDCVEGMEDLEIKSIVQLEDGNLGIEATFNLRIVELSVSIQKEDDDVNRGEIEEADYFFDPEINDGAVIYKMYIRPHFRVAFTFDTKQNYCKRIHVLALSLPKRRKRKIDPGTAE